MLRLYGGKYILRVKLVIRAGYLFTIKYSNDMKTFYLCIVFLHKVTKCLKYTETSPKINTYIK